MPTDELSSQLLSQLSLSLFWDVAYILIGAFFFRSLEVGSLQTKQSSAYYTNHNRLGRCDILYCVPNS